MTHDPLENAKLAVELDPVRGSGHGRLVLTPLSQVRSRSVRFLVPGLVPLRTLTLLAGVGGLGKSTWAAGVAARETRGEYGGQPHNVLVISYEDTAEEIWRPRILAAEGDPRRVLYVTVTLDEGGVVVLPEDMDALEDVIRSRGVRLTVIDPLIAAIDTRLDAFKDQHVRHVLGRMSSLASDTNSSVIGIGHLNKAPSNEPYLRIANSVGFWNAARSVVLVTAEDEEHRLVSQVKANWSRAHGVERHRLEQIVLPEEIDIETGKPVETSRLAFVDLADDVAAHDVLRGRGEDTAADAKRVAEAFLLAALGDGEWHESGHVKALAAAVEISERTLQRAAHDLQIEHERRGFPAETWWRLPQSRQPLSPTVGATGEAASVNASEPVGSPVAPSHGGTGSGATEALDCLLCGTAYTKGEPGSDEAACPRCAEGAGS